MYFFYLVTPRWFASQSLVLKAKDVDSDFTSALKPPLSYRTAP